MKKIVLVLFVALMGTVVMMAQPARGGRMMQDRVEQLTQVLNLDDDQKAQVADILKQGMSHMDQNAKLATPDEGAQAQPKSRRERFKEHNAAVDAKIAAVLNPEQLKKYEQLRKDEQRRQGPRGRGHKDRRHGGDRHQMAPAADRCCQDGNNKGCCDKPAGGEKPTVAGDE